MASKNKSVLGKRTASILCAVVMACNFTSCWDKRELDTLAIVTGMGLDVSENPHEIKVQLQIGDFQSEQGSSGGSGQNGSSNVTPGVSLVTENNQNILTAIYRMRCKTSRHLFLHHNQMIIVSEKLAQNGIKEYFDVFTRNNETRLEVNVFVGEGNIEEILTAVPETEKNSAIAITRMLALEQKITPEFGANMLKFDSDMITGTIATAVPIVKAEKQDSGKSSISFDGLALFYDGKMVGKLKDEEIKGYLLGKSSVKGDAMNVSAEDGSASIHLLSTTPHRKAYVREDGTIVLEIRIEGIATIGELHGYETGDLNEMFFSLQTALNKKVEEIVGQAFHTSQTCSADIFEVGETLYRHDFDQFVDMKAHWRDIYPKVELDVQSNIRMKNTGQAGAPISLED